MLYGKAGKQNKQRDEALSRRKLSPTISHKASGANLARSFSFSFFFGTLRSRFELGEGFEGGRTWFGGGGLNTVSIAFDPLQTFLSVGFRNAAWDKAPSLLSVLSSSMAVVV